MQPIKKSTTEELKKDLDWCLANLDDVRSNSTLYLFYIESLKDLIKGIDGYTAKIDSIYTKTLEDFPNLQDIENMFGAYLSESMKNVKKERMRVKI